jgi:hypothetical protein
LIQSPSDSALIRNPAICNLLDLNEIHSRWSDQNTTETHCATIVANQNKATTVFGNLVGLVALKLPVHSSGRFMFPHGPLLFQLAVLFLSFKSLIQNPL